jgi:hypothetical protein
MDITYIPISDLPGQFKVSRQTIYDRMKFLNISSTKMEGKNYITNDDLDLLDQLDKHLQSGQDKSLFHSGAIAPAGETKLAKQSPQNIVIPTEPEPELTPIIPNLIEQLAKAIAANQTDQLSNYDALEKASNNGWILSTQKIHDLIGVKPHGPNYIWGCWKFTAKGKLGRAKGWLVEKI